jgi:hypothetical protein
MRPNVRDGLVLPVLVFASLVLLGNCTKDEPLSPRSPEGESMKPAGKHQTAPWLPFCRAMTPRARAAMPQFA